MVAAQASGLRVGHGQDDGGGVEVEVLDLDPLHVQVGGQVLDERAQGARGTPAHRTGRRASTTVLEHAERVGPRGGQSPGLPVVDHGREPRVGDREVRRAEVDRSVGFPQATRGHPTAGSVAPVDEPHAETRSPDLAGTGHAGQPGADDRDLPLTGCVHVPTLVSASTPEA